MSLYDYGQPVSTNEYRDKTANHAKMAGVSYATKCCSVCGNHRSLTGSTRRGGKFVCADCSKPAGIFAGLLLGTIAKPRDPKLLPKEIVREIRMDKPLKQENTEAREKHYAAYRARRELGKRKALEFLASGPKRSPDIEEVIEFSTSKTHKLLSELELAGLVKKWRQGNDRRWALTTPAEPSGG